MLHVVWPGLGSFETSKHRSPKAETDAVVMWCNIKTKTKWQSNVQSQPDNWFLDIQNPHIANLIIQPY